MVIPRGRVKDAMSLCTPSSSTHVFLFSGRVAALDDVENPNKATFAVFLMNGLGLTFAIISIYKGNPISKYANKAKNTHKR